MAIKLPRKTNRNSYAIYRMVKIYIIVVTVMVSRSRLRCHWSSVHDNARCYSIRLLRFLVY